MHGIVGPDRPWMLSPPELPVAGATDRNPDEVKDGLPWIDLFP